MVIAKMVFLCGYSKLISEFMPKLNDDYNDR